MSTTITSQSDYPSSSNSASEEPAVVISNSVSRNKAKDSAVQINGHVAGQIYNLNINKVVINMKSPSRSTRESLWRERSFIVASRAHPDVQRWSLPAEACEEDGMVQNQHSQYLKLRSSSGGLTGIACAMFQPELQKNYISPRIVHRMKLNSFTDCTASMSTVIGGEFTVTPTLEYVCLAAPTRSDSEQRRYHFYVVKHCQVRFDIIFGFESMRLL